MKHADRNTTAQLVIVGHQSLAVTNLVDSGILRKMTETALALAKGPGAAAAAGEARVNVLVVEDDELTLEMLKAVLTSLGFQVTTAQDAFQALALTASIDFDLIICDWVMPIMDGGDFYTEVECLKPAFCERFLFMTGNTPETEFGRQIHQFICRIKGAIVYKPFSFEELLLAISDRVGVATATTWFRKAAEAGNSEAQHWLAYRYTDSDKSEHVKWLSRAAEQGHYKAQLRLFIVNRSGYLPSEKQDIIEAYKWARVLAEEDSEHDENLANVRKEMTPEEIARGEYLAQVHFFERKLQQVRTMT